MIYEDHFKKLWTLIQTKLLKFFQILEKMHNSEEQASRIVGFCPTVIENDDSDVQTF